MIYSKCVTNIEIYDDMDCVVEEFCGIPMAREIVVNKYGSVMVNNVAKMVDNLQIDVRASVKHLKKHSYINEDSKLISINTTTPKFNGLYFDKGTQLKCTDNIINIYKWNIVNIVCEILTHKRSREKFAMNFYDNDYIGYVTCFDYVIKTKYYKVSFDVKNGKLVFISSYPIPYLEYNKHNKKESNEVRTKIIRDHKYDGRIINGKIVLNNDIIE